MKFFTKIFMVSFVVFGFAGSTLAATNPDLGTASSFGVLSTTFNVTTATTVNGNVAYVGAGPGVTLTVNGTAYSAGAVRNQAGTDQGNALSIGLAPQSCSLPLLNGVTNLGTDTTHNPALPAGVYEPGVYCTDGAVTAANITLSGAGTYIFRIAGSFDMVAGTSITLTSGADACDVFWTPSAATTFGANVNFKGTVIDDAGITVGANNTWVGRALSFASTVVTDTSTITVPTCTVPAGTGTLHVVKTVINLGGGTAVPSDFIISVHTSTGVFAGSGFGTGTPGTTYLLSSGTYTVTEPINTSYATTFSLLLGDCLNFSISSGDNKTCTVLNTYIIPTPPPSGGSSPILIDSCPNGDYSTSFYDGICGVLPAAASQSIHIVKVANRLTPFPYGGGDVVYTYAVTNPDPTPISNVVVTDDKCGPVTVVGGDVNNDHLLDTNEVWMYTCGMHISVSTRNVATVTGKANGVTVTDTDFANVVVNTPATDASVVIPKLPKTGLTGSMPWSIAILGGIFVIFSISFVVALRKRDI